MNDQTKQNSSRKPSQKDNAKLEEEAMNFDFTRLDKINIIYEIKQNLNPFDPDVIKKMKLKPR